MINYGKVRGTVKPEHIVVDEYSVWHCTDIQEIHVADEYGERTEYEFNQIRYTKDEYIKLIDDRNAVLESNLTDTQLALCEVYEMLA